MRFRQRLILILIVSIAGATPAVAQLPPSDFRAAFRRIAPGDTLRIWTISAVADGAPVGVQRLAGDTLVLLSSVPPWNGAAGAIRGHDFSRIDLGQRRRGNFVRRAGYGLAGFIAGAAVGAGAGLLVGRLLEEEGSIEEENDAEFGKGVFVGGGGLMLGIFGLTTGVTLGGRPYVAWSTILYK